MRVLASFSSSVGALHVGVAHATGCAARARRRAGAPWRARRGARRGAPRTRPPRAAACMQARLLHVALLEQPLVRRQLLLLQLERALLGGDLLGERLGLLHGLAGSACAAPRSGVSSASRRARNSASRAQDLGHLGRPARQQVLRERRLRRRSARSASRRAALARSASSCVRSRSSCASMRTSSSTTSSWPCLHPVAVAHADRAHDAAFLVLHHLAVEVDLDEAGRDDRAGERRADAAQPPSASTPTAITTQAGCASIGALGRGRARSRDVSCRRCRA